MVVVDKVIASGNHLYLVNKGCYVPWEVDCWVIHVDTGKLAKVREVFNEGQSFLYIHDRGGQLDVSNYRKVLQTTDPKLTTVTQVTWDEASVVCKTQFKNQYPKE